MRSISSSRRRLCALGAATAALLASALALPGAASALAPLKVGSGGPRVAAVQKALGLAADRIFGPSTRRAVRRFQRRHGLIADGVVGPATWRLVTRVRAHQRGSASSAGPRSASRPRARTRGSHVALLQRALGLHADGLFGPATARAVRRLQRRRGMTVDGIVGPATWDALGHDTVETILREKPAAVSGPAFAGLPLRVRRVIAAADRIARKPYRYGGGHARWYDRGYDCSGSISFALWGAGLLDAARDASAFMRWASPGRGRWITIYARPSHAFMVVARRRFDTSGRGPGGSRWQTSPRSTAGYVARHPAGL